jgi:hypothetical protein
MVTTLALVAIGLAVLGVVGSLVPVMPGALLSLAGVLLYWWSTGYADPSLLTLAGFVLVALATVAVDLGGSAIAVRAGGASSLTAVVALVAGIVLGLLTGPVGLVVGVAGAAFAVEYYRTGEGDQSGRAALYATVGVLGSTLVQALLTLSMLVALVLVVFL